MASASSCVHSDFELSGSGCDVGSGMIVQHVMLHCCVDVNAWLKKVLPFCAVAQQMGRLVKSPVCWDKARPLCLNIHCLPG